MNDAKIMDFFPFKEVREYQREVCEEVQGAYDAGKKVVVVQGPTGFGKSGVAQAAAGLYGGYLMTHQNILLRQYERDFPEVPLLMGRSQYHCPVTGEKADSAPCVEYHRETADPCFLNKRGGGAPAGSAGVACPYKAALERAAAAPAAIFNYHSFDAHNPAKHQDSPFGPRELLIADEGHRIEQVLMGMVSITLDGKKIPAITLNPSDELAEIALKCRDDRSYQDGPPGEYFLAVAAWKDSIRENIRDATPSQKSRMMKDYQQAVSTLVNMTRIYRLHKAGRLEGRWVRVVDGKRSSLSIKPIFANDLAPRFLFGRAHKVLILSATILDIESFCASIGLEPDQVKYIDVPSTFPVKNRPIYLYPLADMTRDARQRSLPIMLGAIDRIMRLKHPEDRGLIHAHSTLIAKYIHEFSSLSDRLVIHEENSSREWMLQKAKDMSNGVVVGPALYEGLDLKDDLCRFLLFPKVPWPDLGDAQVSARAKADPRWYIWQAMLAVVQGCGRGVRSKDDWCKTYLLDSGFPAFIRRARSHLPPDFLACLKDRSKYVPKLLGVA